MSALSFEIHTVDNRAAEGANPAWAKDGGMGVTLHMTRETQLALISRLVVHDRVTWGEESSAAEIARVLGAIGMRVL